MGQHERSIDSGDGGHSEKIQTAREQLESLKTGRERVKLGPSGAPVTRFPNREIFPQAEPTPPASK